MTYLEFLFCLEKSEIIFSILMLEILESNMWPPCGNNNIFDLRKQTQIVWNKDILNNTLIFKVVLKVMREYGNKVVVHFPYDLIVRMLS